MTLALRRALLMHPFGPEQRQWSEFRDPMAQGQAYRLDEVAACLDEAEAAAKNGHWVVLMLSYDAAPAFDQALVAHRERDGLLAAYAVFASPQPTNGPRDGDYDIGPWATSRTRTAYLDAIGTVRDRIAAGDVYQVNYTIRLSADFRGEPEALFAGLCRAQSADHVAYLDLGGRAVCSASPELFLSRRGTTIETRPMKGTRPRSDDRAEDRALVTALRTSEKDKAENTMIVDMARNDLGRVSRVGSVQTSALHDVESYPTVHQLTSTVTAQSDRPLSELLAATFPAASITGAPKVAACRIIAELESEPRGIYTGAIGVIAPGGDFEFNVAIRTASVDQDRGRIVYGIGGGIVWDSDPAAEWQEAHDKARVLRRAGRPFRLLETLAWRPDEGLVLLQRHLQRLAGAARYFRYDLDVDEVRRRLATIHADRPLRVRVLVDPRGHIEVQQHHLSPTSVSSPVMLPLDTEPVDADDEFLRYKTTRRERYEAARARFPEAVDVVLWNERGEVTESTVANVVVELDGRLITPSVTASLLPGVLRAELLAAGRIREGSVTVADLMDAGGGWLINSVRGWTRFEIQAAPARVA